MNKGIQKFYINLPETYELVNHLMTWGLDVRWRKKAAAIAAEGGGTRWLDMCSGTGEMAAYLSSRAGQDTAIIAADFSHPMLSRVATKPACRHVLFALGEALHLPFASQSFDLVTISFATRNINVNRQALLQCFREFHRVLRPGGRFVNIETSQPPNRLIRWLVHTYVGIIVKPLGMLISGHKAPYVYLSRSIRGFYTADELAAIITEAGFSHVDYHRLCFGTAAIHKAVK